MYNFAIYIRKITYLKISFIFDSLPCMLKFQSRLSKCANVVVEWHVYIRMIKIKYEIHVIVYISPQWMNDIAYQQVTNPVGGISILIARSQTIHHFDDISPELLMWFIALSFAQIWQMQSVHGITVYQMWSLPILAI